MTHSMTQPLSEMDSQKVDLINQKLGKQLVAWAKSEFGKMKESRNTAQRQWYYNLSMYYGKQYYDMVSLRNGNRLMKVPRAPRHKVRHTVNLIRPMIRSEIARMTSQKPTATVTPATTETGDMFAAQAAEQVWEFLQNRRSFHQKMMRNAFWTSICGTSFMKTWWEDDYSEDTALLAQSLVPATGDVLMDVTTPFNLFIPDLIEQDIENQPYVIEAYTKPLAWVKMMYPWLDHINADSVSRNEIIETSYFNVSDEQSRPDSVLVMECWVKPGGSSILPQGGMFTIVGDTIVQEPTEGLPYTHNQYPYTKFEHIPTGKFYGDSVLIDINHLQREYNRTRSHIIESKALMGRPQLLVAEGSVDENKLTAQPGLIIRYKMGFPQPQPMPLQPLPSYILQEQDRIKSDMEDISGQHSVTRGGVPGGGVTAATAISFLQEQDDSIMGPTYASIERGCEKIARQALTLVVDHYNLPRIIETTGLGKSFDSLELKGSDISRGTNLRVESGSALPQSKSARQAFLMDLAKMGVISGNDMLDMLDIGGVGRITEKLRVDKRQAQRENLKMKKLTAQEIEEHDRHIQMAASQGSVEAAEFDPNSGLPTILSDTPATFPPVIEVNEWDNHPIHIQVLNDFRKTQEFENLSPIVQEQFARHAQDHKKAMIMSTMAGGMLMPPEGEEQGEQPGVGLAPPAEGGNSSERPQSTNG